MPAPSFFNLNTDTGPTAKKSRFGPPTNLVVPHVPYVSAGNGSIPSSSNQFQPPKIYYPSQDPHRLGAKGDVEEK